MKSKKPYFTWRMWPICLCTNVLYEFTLSTRSRFSLFFCRGHNSSWDHKLGITVTHFFPELPPVYGPFWFLAVGLCDAKCHWEYPNMSALVRFNCLASLKEGTEWRQFYCADLCAIHVPFPYNRFLVYVWALGRSNLNEQLFVTDRDWDNWSTESSKVYCH